MSIVNVASIPIWKYHFRDGQYARIDRVGNYRYVRYVVSVLLFVH